MFLNNFNLKIIHLLNFTPVRLNLILYYNFIKSQKILVKTWNFFHDIMRFTITDFTVYKVFDLSALRVYSSTLYFDFALY